MENPSFIKQAKSDIHQVLYPLINFYIKKGAKATSLKKYYKNSKRFNDILDDINNKGSNLIKDDIEYKKVVREILNDILDDFIIKEKDQIYKNKSLKPMKHIKEFYQFEIITEGAKIEEEIDFHKNVRMKGVKTNEELSTFQHIILSAGAAFCIYKFVKGLLLDILDRNGEKLISKMDKISLNNLSIKIGKKLESGKKSEFSEDFVYYTIKFDDDLIIKINKQKKYMIWTITKDKFVSPIYITQEEIDGLISTLKEENNEKL